VLVSELSGKSTVLRKAREMGFSPSDDDERLGRVLRHLKEREHEGYQYEAADGSFELLLRQELQPYEPLFELESFRVIVEKRADGKTGVEATIKVHVGGQRVISTAEGNGPVNALDGALRRAILGVYPHLADIELVNFRVRILDEAHGTGAVTRVLLDASDGEESWGTIGVSENIIEASWEALVDSIEYGLLRGERA
jgi:2-isopropylmalate synthase